MKRHDTDRYTLYKLDISYFSGKLESYMRYKEIPHKVVDCTLGDFHRIGQRTGTQKIPAIEMQDGRWLYDTTPTIQWVEQQHPEAPVLPNDPALRFVALLLEDYCDEWLWRPAMWWRWVPKISRVTLGRSIARIYSQQLAIPMGWYFGRRQLREWVWGDGVGKHNSADVRDMLFRELEFLEGVLQKQPYILGSHPTVADFGYFGPFFRHFGCDPVSSEVMRRHGPNTYEWLARLWNAKHSALGGAIEWQWPTDTYWEPLLERIAKDYLPYLHQNARAFRDDRDRFDYQGENFTFKRTTTTRYRVWCRQQLQKEFEALDLEDQQKVESLFSDSGGLAALHTDGTIDARMDEQLRLPLDPETVRKKPGLFTRYYGQPRN